MQSDYLTDFRVIFFTEIMNKTVFMPCSIVVGLALCLFWFAPLLLRTSGFNPAYLLSSALTLHWWRIYVQITREKAVINHVPDYLGIYIYIFVLIQLETFCGLLAGSLRLFIILAIVMYFSKKIDWFNEQPTFLLKPWQTAFYFCIFEKQNL